jgi:predicted permease
MPDPRRDDWTSLVRARAEAQGRDLSPDVVDELAGHLADAQSEARDRGQSDDEAHRAAMLVLDDAVFVELAARLRARHLAPSRLSERTGNRLGRLWSDLAFDVRYSLRTMRRSVGFSAVVIVILAIGIGASTAAFTVIDAVLLHALPYPRPDQLVVLERVTSQGDRGPLAPADWRDYASRNAASLALAAYASWPMNLTGGGEPVRLRSFIVSGNFFDVVGQSPLRGRGFAASDDTPSAPGVVMLAYGFWSRRFGGDPAALGTTVVVNGHPATIVGVMPPEFAVPNNDVDVWMPMGLSPEVLSDRASKWLSVVGRLRPDVRPSEAQAALSVTAAALAAQFPRTNTGERPSVTPLLEVIVGGVRRALWLGAAAVMVVLLVGCANVANLMLARATVRRDEMALRSALGAEPGRLTRQLLAEGGVLAAAGCVVGMAAAALFLRAFVVLGEGRVPRIEHAHLNTEAIVVSVLVSVFAVVLFGGGTAWLLLRCGRATASHHEGRRWTASSRLGGLLLAGQIAFAMVLLAGALLVARSYAATMRIEPGLDVSDTLTMRMTLPKSRYTDSAAHVRFVERALEQLAAVPGITSAGVISDLPFSGNQMRFPTELDPAVNEPARTLLVVVRLADPGYFRTTRVPLLAGRSFESTDRAGTDPVALVNRTAAERLWGSAAIDRHVRVSGDSRRRIVGVVGDTRHAGLRTAEDSVVYVPYAQKSFDFLNWIGIVVRGQEITASASRLKAAIAQVDPNQPVSDVMAMDEYVAKERAPYRFSSLVIGCLAGAAFVLAITGIYGLTTFIVGNRFREIGVRLALGASRAGVVLLVMRQIAAMLALGSIVGLAGSVTTVGLLRAAMFDSSGADPTVLAGAATLLVVTAFFAALGPALKAARIDPRVALQSE